MVKIIVAKEKRDCEHLLGTFLDESHYDILVEEDTDCYTSMGCGMEYRTNCNTSDCADCKEFNTKDERKIAFKFRKNFFSKEEQEEAYAGLKEAAKASQNRGLAAGPKGAKLQGREWATPEQLKVIDYLRKLDDSAMEVTQEDIDVIKANANLKADNRGLVWLSSEKEKYDFNYDTWLAGVLSKPVAVIKGEAEWVYDNLISDTTYANPVLSGVAGWYDRYPRIPYGRATAYTQHCYDKFKRSFPFLQTLNRGFKDLMPWRWNNQKEAADKLDQRFLVPDTVFTTITVNNTFRTAAHRDAGDLNTGLSNLLVLSNDGRFTGGYLIFPEYRIAVNVRPGDLLLVNNHEVIHGNTPIVAEEGSERISLVCYFREAMLELGSWEYEQTRYEFVESRRLNKEHPEWRPLWNGVSAKMWDTHEWYEFLKNKDVRLYDEHMRLIGAQDTSSLESLFG